MKVDREKLHATKQKSTLHMLLHTSSRLTSVLIRLNVTANQTTFLSCISGLLGVLALHTEFKIFSILFFYFYTVLDYSDGWVARYTETESTFGEHLDHINHTIVSIFLLLTVAVLTEQYLACSLAIVLFLFSIYKHCHDPRLLGNFYEKIIVPVGSQLFIELLLYSSIIFSCFELTFIAHLVLYGAIFMLSVITKIKEKLHRSRNSY